MRVLTWSSRAALAFPSSPFPAAVAARGFPAVPHPSSGTARGCRLADALPCSSRGFWDARVPHAVCPAEHVHLPAHREGNPLRDPGPGQGPAAHTLGADGLWSPVHGFPQVPHHHAHRPVSILGWLSCLVSQYPSMFCPERQTHGMAQLSLALLLFPPSLSRYFLTSFYTKYDRIHFIINTISLMSVLIPKLPQFHGVRIFGINKY